MGGWFQLYLIVESCKTKINSGIFGASNSKSNSGGRHMWCGKEKPTVWEHTGLYAPGGGPLNEGKVRLVRIITRGGKPQRQKGNIARKQNCAKCTGNKPLNQFFTAQEVTSKNKNHEGLLVMQNKISTCLPFSLPSALHAFKNKIIKSCHCLLLKLYIKFFASVASSYQCMWTSSSSLPSAPQNDTHIPLWVLDSKIIKCRKSSWFAPGSCWWKIAADASLRRSILACANINTFHRSFLVCGFLSFFYPLPTLCK